MTEPATAEAGEQEKKDLLTIARGGGMTFFGRLAFTGLGYLFTLALARMLGPGEYGQFVIGFSLVVVASSLALLGLNRGLVRFLAIYRGEGDAGRQRGAFRFALVASLAAALALAALLTAFAGPVADLLDAPPAFRRYLWGFAAWIPLWVLLYQLAAALEGIKRVAYRALFFDVVWPLGRLLLSVGALLLGWGLTGVIWAGVAASVISAALLGTAVRRHFLQGVRAAAPIAPARAMLAFSLPVMLFNVVNVTQNQLEVLLLGVMQSAEASGIFNIAARTAIVSVALLEGMGLIFSPFIADLTHRRKLESLRSLLAAVTRWSFTVGLGVSTFTILFARPILQLFGEAYTAAHSALVILSVAHLINAATGPAGYVVNMAGYSRLNLANALVGLALNLVLDWLLIPRYGIVGAALGAGLAVVAVNLLRLLEVWWTLRVHAYDRRFVKPVLAAALAGASAALTAGRAGLPSPLLTLLLGAALFGAVFAGGLWALRLEESDRLILATIRDRLSGPGGPATDPSESPRPVE